MKIDNFTDDKIGAIQSGVTPLTNEEREFLLQDTPRFEECVFSLEELQSMPDSQLMRACYSVWADYSR